MRRIFSGADALVASLEDLGVGCVFGLPGSQNVELFESLRTSTIRTVLTTSEAAAGFMANGAFRASGNPAVVAAIPGPGFAWTLPALAEANLDSAQVMVITGKPPDREYDFDLQKLSQRQVADALGVPVFDVNNMASLSDTIHAAWREMSVNASQPVVVQIDESVLKGDWSQGGLPKFSYVDAESIPSGIDEVVEALSGANKPLVFAGLGSLPCAVELQSFVERVGAAVITTPSARGVVPEGHPNCLAVDFLCDGTGLINEFIDSSDMVIALGCRFSHNGTGGFGLRIAESRLAHVDVDANALQKNYPANWPLRMDVGRFLETIDARLPDKLDGWDPAEIDAWRERLRSERAPFEFEPLWLGDKGCSELFRKISSALPDDAIVVTDTGLHQILARTWFEISSPRGLIFPSDFQSMGFGLPAAVGASLSAPDRPVVALVGDGSMLMVGTEVLTAMREGICLPILVFSDGALGQIRLQQLKTFGNEAATALEPIDLSAFAGSLGADYILGSANLEDELAAALEKAGPTIIEIRLADHPSLQSRRKKSALKAAMKSAIGPSATRALKRLRK